MGKQWENRKILLKTNVFFFDFSKLRVLAAGGQKWPKSENLAEKRRKFKKSGQNNDFRSAAGKKRTWTKMINF
jgi:hypothetical protein